MSDLTVQINLSAGDAEYAELTVPPLLAAHETAAERLLVVDLCKPQRTAIVDPATRFPEPRFSDRLQRITRFADSLLRSGRVDRVEYVAPNSPLLPAVSRKWLRPWLRETHDYGGCALMSYLAAFELCRTPWMVHYDADMLLHSADGYDWAAAAQAAIATDQTLVAATPLPAPPLPEPLDAPTATERLPFSEHVAGWRNAWFSTRCYLFNVPRLHRTVPLIQGQFYWRTFTTRLLRRGYPPAPEIMLFRRLRSAGLWRLVLRDRRAWLLHPTKKDDGFVAALPRLLAAVSSGECPDEQRGYPDLNLDWWRRVLA